MPVFTDAKYADHDLRPTAEEAWRRLPPILYIQEDFPIRWVGPLIELDLASWLSDMSEAAWGIFQTEWEWDEDWPECAVLLPDGSIDPRFCSDFMACIVKLCELGERMGPECDAGRWGAWAAFEFADLREVVETKAKRVDAHR